MKKMLFSLSVLLASSYALATVESNIAGYESSELNTNVFKMMAVQFTTLDGTDIKLNSMFEGAIPYGSQVQVLRSTGSAYDIYTYLEEAYDEANDDFVPGWADGTETLTDASFSLGTSFWLKLPTGTTLAVTGGVSSDASVTKSTSANIFTMLAGGYPVGVNLNDLSWTGLSYGDSVQVLKASGSAYDVYTYLEEAYDEAADDFVPGWADGTETLMQTPIPSGSGFWIKTQNAVTVSFPTPIVD